MTGTIMKGIGGFYYIKVEDIIYRCKARGAFKNKGIKPAVGDLVIIELQDVGDGWITDILPRKNSFIRPPIANVDCLVLVFAAAEPEPNMGLIDKFLVMAEKNHTDVILCINKIDLVDHSKIESLKDIYEGIYPLLCIKGNSGDGLEELKEALKGKKCALAGPSGVGKSTILNSLSSNLLIETGEISKKTKRGKHTTRHSELFETDFGAMIFDTPGFTSFDVLDVSEEELSGCYPEMQPYLNQCRYDNCRHIMEPQCSVIEALKEGKIKASRYRSYKQQHEEIKERGRR